MPHTFDPQPMFDYLGAYRSDVDWAVALGTTKRSIERAKTDGLSFVQADRWACHLGLHPALIWPEWHDAVIDEHLDRLVADDPTILHPTAASLALAAA